MMLVHVDRFQSKKNLRGKIYQAVVLHKPSSNLGVILQLMDVFADVAVWNGAGLTSLTPS